MAEIDRNTEASVEVNTKQPSVLTCSRWDKNSWLISLRSVKWCVKNVRCQRRPGWLNDASTSPLWHLVITAGGNWIFFLLFLSHIWWRWGAARATLQIKNSSIITWAQYVLLAVRRVWENIQFNYQNCSQLRKKTIKSKWKGCQRLFFSG